MTKCASGLFRFEFIISCLVTQYNFLGQSCKNSVQRVYVGESESFDKKCNTVYVILQGKDSTRRRYTATPTKTHKQTYILLNE